MKKNLIILGLTLAGAAGVFGQGSVTLNPHGGVGTVDFHIYGPEADNSRVSGNVSTTYANANHAGEFPTGTAVYDGGLIGGNNVGTGTYQQANGGAYEIELAGVQGAGPVGTANLIPSSTENFLTTLSGAGGTGNSGWFSAESVVIPGTSGVNADTAEMQIYAWYEGSSQYTSYAAAVAAGVPSGFSDPFSGGTSAPPNTGALITGARSFNLTTSASPEPSTIALGIMGASAFLLRRRMSK